MKLIGIGANNPETIRMVNAINKVDPSFEFTGFIDNDPDKKGIDFYGYRVIGSVEKIQASRDSGIKYINLITRDCITRYETSIEAYKYGAIFANFIHPNVSLELIDIGLGNYIQESVILQAGVRVGNNSSIHMGALIGHESNIGNSVFIAHGCNISGLVNIEDGVFLGAGVTVVPRVKIGKWSLIGAGSVITKDIPPYSLVYGNPAKVIKSINKGFDSGDIL